MASFTGILDGFTTDPMVRLSLKLMLYRLRGPAREGREEAGSVARPRYHEKTDALRALEELVTLGLVFVLRRS
ncbi:hypothetical protein CFAM422_005782 [Trichoderma lentiforme]|uniref:Uncharacterized protein n=1 Tax=Trichoderma lentiforme TaxID=1567552 RepID=A0A9P5CE26_9HYPO|nr:hypothetical protein CFAM422_005782 [Trichoderma lentiforme]